MSHYNDFETEITDPVALARALSRCKYRDGHTLTVNQIVNVDQAINLVGYHGDTREQKAHVIVRRQYVGSASNDIGFVKGAEGKFSAIISDYDKTYYNGAWLVKLFTYYNVEKTKLAFEQKGITYTETQDDKGRIQLRAKFKTDSVSRIKVGVKHV